MGIEVGVGVGFGGCIRDWDNLLTQARNEWLDFKRTGLET